MSEKSSRSIRSKIPRFQGPRNTSTTAVALHSRIHDLQQREETIDKPGYVINTLDADKHEKPSNNEDIPFEPDPQALKCILSNKGINCGAARASEITPSLPVNRLSMWDSFNEFKENLRQYRETFPQWNASMKTDLKSQTPTGSCKQSATLTPRSGRPSPKPEQMSLTQSLELHKENIKIFREKMQNIDNDLQTPRPARNHLYSQFSPKQRQRGLTNTAHASSPAMPANNYVRKAWSELKENRPPHAGIKKPGALSTSKIYPSKLCAIDETSPAFSCTSKEDMCHSFRPVRRALHLVSDENEATERPASFSGCNKAPQEYCNSLEHNQPARVSSSLKDDQIQQSLYSCGESGSSLGLPAPNGLVFKSPDIQMLRLTPVFLTPKSPFPSYVRNAVSTTECTWSCQQTLCTPKLKTRERVQETAHSFQSLHNTQTDSKSMADPLKFFSDNTQTQAVTSIGSAAEFLRTYKASQAAKASHLPLSSAGELNDWFNKLHLSSGPTLCTAVSSQSCVSVPKLWQATTPPVLKTPISSTPVRVFQGKTMMSNTVSMSSASSLSTGYPKLAVTPMAQMSRSLVKDLRSPATYLSSQPARGSEAVASCLKNRQFILDNTDGLSMNYAVSTMKKLRWADSQHFGKGFEVLIETAKYSKVIRAGLGKSLL